MNFYFHKLVLWLDNNEKRELLFKPNKVNVITGGSNTGKSAILQIIDYCLFASTSKISESIINENVLWYGINIHINDKNYTICRKCLQKGIVSQEYYFSSSGEIPDMPTVNSDEKTIKPLLETEFGIDHNVTIPFGSKVLRSGSKISLRYFLIFTTISEDIITDSTVYFDKQNEARYREALLRIFDLAVGIDDIENILAKEKK
ncbi:MAG: AAA family ATPase, partial [Nitrososphaeraceae archaeon]